MKEKFTLSKSNKIYFGVVAALSLVLFVASFDKTPYQIGELAGRLISFLLFPSLFAWIIWRLSGKKEKGGNVTFNIVLTLVLLGQIGQQGSNLQQSKILGEIQEQTDEFKKKALSMDPQSDFNASYNGFVESVEEGLSSLSETSTGTEKKLYEIMSEFTADTQITVQNWLKAYTAVQSPRILDYSLLDGDEEFEYQRNVLRSYIEQTRAYDKLFAHMIPDLRQRLNVLGENHALVKEAIKGAAEKYDLQKPIFEPLIQVHAQYGQNLIKTLDFLQRNMGEWSYDNEELLFSNENVLNEYNDLFEELRNNEATINTLSAKLLEAM